MPDQPDAAGALDDKKRCGNQDVATESKDDGGGMQGPQPAEAEPGRVEIQGRKDQLPGDDVAGQKPGNPPEDRGDDTGADDGIVIALLLHPIEPLDQPVQQPGQRRDAADEHDLGMGLHHDVLRHRDFRPGNGDQ